MLKNYLKLSWKVLGRNRFFTFVSLFGITFTIGILLVLTTFFENVLNPGAPEVNRSRSLYLLNVTLENQEHRSSTSAGVGYGLYNRYLQKMKTPEKISLTTIGEAITTISRQQKVSLVIKRTCDNFWEVNEFSFIEGRAFGKRAIEQREYVAVITESARDAYFGKGAKAIGEQIKAGGGNYRVIGIIENVPAAQLMVYADVYVPYVSTQKSLGDRYVGEYIVSFLGAREADLPRIQAEFNSLIQRVEMPEDYDTIEARALTVPETISAFLNRGEPTLGILTSIVFGAMFLFMLLPALNLVNLNSSRILERSSEIGVRKAFGATTSTLTMQFLVENVVLTLLGGVLGLCLAFWLLNLIESSELIPHLDLQLNWRVYGTAILLCLFFGLLSGVLPALRMSRLRIVHALKGQSS
ncbi:MAG: FtsX-like permease family protein [Bacteroidota bacterium]